MLLEMTQGFMYTRQASPPSPTRIPSASFQPLCSCWHPSHSPLHPAPLHFWELLFYSFKDTNFFQIPHLSKICFNSPYSTGLLSPATPPTPQRLLKLMTFYLINTPQCVLFPPPLCFLLLLLFVCFSVCFKAKFQVTQAGLGLTTSPRLAWSCIPDPLSASTYLSVLGLQVFATTPRVALSIPCSPYTLAVTYTTTLSMEWGCLFWALTVFPVCMYRRQDGKAERCGPEKAKGTFTPESYWSLRPSEGQELSTDSNHSRPVDLPSCKPAIF